MNKQMKDLLLSLALEDGQVRVECPICHSAAPTLCVTRQGNQLLWNCHRAVCQNRGRMTLRDGYNKATLRLLRLELQPETSSTNSQQQTRKQHKWHPTSEKQRKGYKKRTVLDQNGEIRGIVWRREQHAPKSWPKDINDIDQEWVKLHFPSPFKGDSVILVEDIISANKMDKHFPCIALLGVHLSEEKLNFLLTLGVKRVIIALDNDATLQALRIAKRYCVNTRVLHLQRDFKDDTEENLKAIAEKL